jgi:hypothetical protein
MLTRPEVRRYSTQSGLRDMMIAEKEIVLTFLLQLLSEHGILDRLAFKGGTCLLGTPFPPAIDERVLPDRETFAGRPTPVSPTRTPSAGSVGRLVESPK